MINTKAFQFKVNKPPPSQNILCTYKGETIMSDDNITMLLGKKKTGKGIICQDFLHGSLSSGYSPLGFKWGKCPVDKKVYYFDTELSKSEFYTRLDILYKVIGENIYKLEAFNIKEMSIIERRKFIVDILNKKNDAYFIIIDVVSDLLIDFNSITESGEVLDLLQEVSVKNNAPILTTLHLNPSDNIGHVTKGRGHLGTLLGNKSQSTILTSKKQKKFKATFSDLRNGDLTDEEIHFIYNKKTLYKGVINNIDERDKKATCQMLNEKPCTLPELIKSNCNNTPKAIYERWVKENFNKRKGVKGKYFV